MRQDLKDNAEKYFFRSATPEERSEAWREYQAKQSEVLIKMQRQREARLAGIVQRDKRVSRSVDKEA